MLTVKRAPVATSAGVRSRRTAVRVSAWAGDKGPWAGLLRMFTPNKYIETKEDWTGTGSNFTGKISHKARKPFKDGFINKMEKTSSSSSSSSEPVAARQQQLQEQQQEGSNAIDYLNDAAERVVGHNFKGDDTEPDWSKTGRKGYSGTSRRPKQHREDGPFHNRVL